MEKKPQTKLRALRALHQVDQKRLADLIGVTLSTYSHKETGKHAFTLYEAKKIADFFGRTIEDIFFGNEHHKLKIGGEEIAGKG